MSRITSAGLDRLWTMVAEKNVPQGLLIDGRYQVDRRLGIGGMGEVFMAQDVRLNRPVAMKFLGQPDPGWAARFEAEAKTLGHLEHEGIVPVYDLGLLPDGRLYYTMKYVAGSTLEMLTGKTADRRRLLTILIEACRIVAHAHEQGILHRDLKPGNIMVGERDRVFVMDWGVARLRRESGQNSAPDAPAVPGRTSAGEIFGTPEYMAPEQAQGERDRVDERSDVYSLGVILREILLDPAPDADLAAIPAKCLEQEPARRYAGARELADDLSRYLAGEAVRAHSPSVPYRLTKFVSRRKMSVTLAAAATIAAVAVALLLPQWLVERGRAKRREAELAAQTERQIEDLRRREAARPYLREGDLILEEMRIRLRNPNYTRPEMEALAARSEGRFKEALREHPDDADAWLGIGRAWRLAGDEKKALSALGRAITASPGFSTAYLERARMRVMPYAELRHEPSGGSRKETPVTLKLRSEIEADLERVERTTSKSHEKLYAQGVLAAAEGKYRECVDLLGQYVESRPEEPEAHLVRGYALIRLNDYDRAIEAFTKSLECDARSVLALLDRSSAYLDRGDIEAAISDCDRALKIKSDYAEAYVNRATARKAKGDGLALSERLVEARVEWDGAIADCDRALTIRNDFAEAWAVRGNARQAKGDREGAISDYDSALKIKPELAAAWNGRGLARWTKGDFDGALSDFDHALAVRTDLPEPYSNRGLVRRMKGDLDGALSDFDHALAIKKDCAQAYNGRGLVKGAKGDWDGALAEYDRALAIRKDFAGAYDNRGIAKRQKGDLDGAVADFDRAVSIQRDFAEAYFDRGEVKQGRGDVAGALADYDRAIGLKKDFVEAYSNRGILRRITGDLEGAIEDYDRALAIKKDFAEACNGRGLAEMAKGDLEGAIADFGRALEIKKDLAEAYANRGNAERAKGDLDAARADYRRVLEVAPPNSPLRVMVQRLLDSLSSPAEKRP